MLLGPFSPPRLQKVVQIPAMTFLKDKLIANIQCSKIVVVKAFVDRTFCTNHFLAARFDAALAFGCCSSVSGLACAFALALTLALALGLAAAAFAFGIGIDLARASKDNVS